MWGESARISRIEELVSRLTESVAKVTEGLTAHVNFCTERERKRDDAGDASDRVRDKEHAENKLSISELKTTLDDTAKAQRRLGIKVTGGLITILLTMLGWIAAQSFHVHVSVVAN